MAPHSHEPQIAVGREPRFIAAAIVALRTAHAAIVALRTAHAALQ